MDDWQTILAEHGDAVWRRAYRLLGNDAAAADCFQDAFAAAVTLSRREPVRKWLALWEIKTCVAGFEPAASGSVESTKEQA
jgi:DNA-directed RNA polymerase specialized sigma24 family protein